MSLPGDARAADAGNDCTSIVKRAFEKTLAITKVGMECELKMSKLAQENSDAHTCFFIGCCTEQKVCACASCTGLPCKDIIDWGLQDPLAK